MGSFYRDVLASVGFETLAESVAMKAEIARLRAKCDERKQRIERYRSTVAHQKADLETIAAENSKLRQQVSTLNSMVLGRIDLSTTRIVTECLEDAHSKLRAKLSHIPADDEGLRNQSPRYNAAYGAQLEGTIRAVFNKVQQALIAIQQETSTNGEARPPT